MGAGWGQGKGRVETHRVPYYWETEFFWCCQFYITQGLRGGKWVNLYRTEKIQPL